MSKTIQGFPRERYQKLLRSASLHAGLRRKEYGILRLPSTYPSAPMALHLRCHSFIAHLVPVNRAVTLVSEWMRNLRYQKKQDMVRRTV